ncbi:MAG: hypothetical protein H0V72_27430 [Bradyrhizobium sp.]|nr:hypothetical protein [Bradyrhizobium sp.]
MAYLFLAYFSLAWNSSLWIFCDEDLMRSSNRRNSAVSSAIDLGGGLGGKGSISDIGKTSLGFIPRGVFFSCAIAAFLRRRFSRAPGMRLK